MRISDWSSDVCSSDLFAHSSLRRCLMAPTAAHPSTSPIIVSGQLTLRTIRGRNGPFTVGRLTTHLGVFEGKDAELAQYPEGKSSEENTSELQSLMRISSAVSCLKKKKTSPVNRI